MNLNLNDIITVQLTRSGIEALDEFTEKVSNEKRPTTFNEYINWLYISPDELGNIKVELKDLMYVFGSKMNFLDSQLFVNESLKIEQKELELTEKVL